MLGLLKLPFAFDAARLKTELAQIHSSDWVPHFNTQEFEGDWSVVRLLRLGAGSRIREHRDFCLGFEDGEVRIHVPVVTSPLVEFYSAGRRIEMREGEAWYVNFNLPHRLYNGAAFDRVHLVIDGPVNDWVRSLFYTLNFEQFRMRVLDQSATELGSPDADGFVADLVRKGAQLGYTFAPEQVQRAFGLGS